MSLYKFFFISSLIFLLGMPSASAGQDKITKLYDRISVLTEKGKIKKSVKTAEKALKIARKKFPHEPLQEAKALAVLANQYQLSKNTVQEEETRKQETAILEKVLGPDHPQTVKSLWALGKLYGVQKKYAKAELVFTRLLHIHRESTPPDDKTIFTLYKILRGLYRFQEQHDKSADISRTILVIQEDTFGQGHQYLIDPLFDLGKDEENQGNLLKAESLYQKALHLVEKNKLESAVLLSRLGKLYEKLGQKENAAEFKARHKTLMDKIELIKDKSNQWYHFNTETITFQNQNKHAEAIAPAQKALEIAEKYFESDTDRLSASLRNLAVSYYQTGQYKTSEPLFARALDLHEKKQGADHADLAPYMLVLAKCLTMQKKHTDAEALFKRALALPLKSFEVKRGILISLAEMYKRAGQLDKTKKTLQDTIGFIENSMGPDAQTLVAPLSQLADLRFSSGQTAEAEPLYKRVMDITIRHFGEDHPDVIAALTRLAVIYGRLGRAEEENKIKMKLKELN